VEVEVEEEEEEGEEEEVEEEETPPPPPWVVVVVRPAWMEMDPMKGPPDLPSKGTTRWGDEED
jgi:hypothetical protein